MTDDSNKPLRAAPSVFLSYSRADKSAVRQVAERLQDAGIRVWWDELRVDGLPVSARFKAGATHR